MDGELGILLQETLQQAPIKQRVHVNLGSRMASLRAESAILRTPPRFRAADRAQVDAPWCSGPLQHLDSLEKLTHYGMIRELAVGKRLVMWGHLNVGQGTADEL